MSLRGIALYLHAAGAGILNETGSTGTIYLFHLPASPDSIISLFPAPGAPSSGTFGYDNPSIQIRVRGTNDPRVAYNKAAEIYALLHGLHQVTLPDGTWLLKCLGMSSGPVPMGTDNNGRYEFVLRFDTEIENITIHREN